MNDRPIRPSAHVFAADSATTTHLKKALTTAHLQQALSQSVVSPTPLSPAARGSGARALGEIWRREQLTLSLADNLAAASLCVAVVSLLVAAGALAAAILAVRRADMNSSAAMIVTLNQGFAQSWRLLLDAPTDRKSHEFAELMNAFEIAAAVYLQGSLKGVSKELLEDYLCHTLSTMNEDDGARRLMAALQESPKTFRYVIRFIDQMKRSGRVPAGPA